MTKQQEHPVYGVLEEGTAPSSEKHGFVTDGSNGVYIVKRLDGPQATPVQSGVVIEPAPVDEFDEPIWDYPLTGESVVPSYVADEFGDEEEVLYIGPEEVEEPEPQKHIVPTILSTTPDIDESLVPFGNVIDMDEDYIADISKQSETYTEALTDLMLKHHAPLSFAGESANAHLEAVMRDCFGTEVEPDVTIESYIHTATQVDMLSFIINQQKNIPDGMKRYLLKQLTDSVVASTNRELNIAKSSNQFRKLRSELENAQVRTKSNLGTTRGLSNPKYSDGMNGS